MLTDVPGDPRYTHLFQQVLLAVWVTIRYS